MIVGEGQRLHDASQWYFADYSHLFLRGAQLWGNSPESLGFSVRKELKKGGIAPKPAKGRIVPRNTNYSAIVSTTNIQL